MSHYYHQSKQQPMDAIQVLSAFERGEKILRLSVSAMAFDYYC